ncbi:DUF1707 domain-containing protein [Ornithinimicrobium ciconiae]|uniref:DUF1707 domain-containing protein n=1 Tax=Ornithinimicrobium ciconiae TaxID=2594265 RepID=A0A516G751_9MICO|nr:DUF1707 domain-containing protein [Ornithinimicrobium ciconiae]QDO87349.1 DUF1707 domain-containing protein [Ornithinimicrobium ciconiae]
MTELRIGTRERERVVRSLMRHQGMGRLTAQEYQERVARARAAVVASDLDGLLDDLEAPAEPREHE